ncbi:type IV pilus modification PilV family protein [Demequina lignilytica]|uniref:Type II secretion system protein n=1 Tax=Demequina lignilytica TaxID=3051663 RepID=A0AB35ME50_9MICO|nr:type II secretion system protein [Demequina sp. SYSU T0a273]MDN4482053.1 type II secretion system protein [Demequina sp. SYSU T0a273]
MRRMWGDEGFGLTEVMVAMLLLVIIMMAMITAVVLALQVTARNGTTATAAEAVQQRIELVRSAAVAGDCDVIELAALPASTVTDGRGVDIAVNATLVKKGTSDACQRAASAADRDPVQVLTLTVTADSAAPDANNPVVTTTTDILMKFQP